MRVRFGAALFRGTGSSSGSHAPPPVGVRAFRSPESFGRYPGVAEPVHEVSPGKRPHRQAHAHITHAVVLGGTAHARTHARTCVHTRGQGCEDNEHPVIALSSYLTAPAPPSFHLLRFASTGQVDANVTTWKRMNTALVDVFEAVRRINTPCFSLSAFLLFNQPFPSLITVNDRGPP